jgi:hypothetical protein
MEVDGLEEMDVAESILNAVAIYKKIRATSPARKKAREYLYIIQSPKSGWDRHLLKGQACARIG